MSKIIAFLIFFIQIAFYSHTVQHTKNNAHKNADENGNSFGFIFDVTREKKRSEFLYV